MKGGGIHTIGRRKTSVARVYLKAGAGSLTDNAITVNAKPMDEYFERETSRMVVRQPLNLVGDKKFEIKVNVCGGGKSGQAGAVRLGIARALVKFDQENRGPIKAEGFLSRDAREVERKKYGRHKARKRPQYSKR